MDIWCSGCIFITELNFRKSCKLTHNILSDYNSNLMRADECWKYKWKELFPEFSRLNPTKERIHDAIQLVIDADENLTDEVKETLKNRLIETINTVYRGDK